MPDIRIVVVEDETIVAMDLTATLKGIGCTVLAVVDNGIDAIETAIAQKPDLVLMDIRLKGAMDGIEAAKAIQERRRSRSSSSPRTATSRRSTAPWARRPTATW